MKIDQLGFLSGEGTRWHASPFFDERSDGCVPELVVIHNISLPARQFGTGCVQGLFGGTLDCSLHPTFDSLKGLEVSTHFFVDRQGHVTQFVNSEKRAWHAGLSCLIDIVGDCLKKYLANILTACRILCSVWMGFVPVFSVVSMLLI